MRWIAVLVLGLAASAMAEVAGEDSFERAIRQADLQWGIHAGDGIGRAEYYGRLMRRIMDGRVSVDYVDRARRPVLSSAVIYGGLREVERLLQMGADPDGGGHAMPPLIQAMSPCQPQKAALLLRYGADPDGAHGEYGHPPSANTGISSCSPGCRPHCNTVAIWRKMNEDWRKMNENSCKKLLHLSDKPDLMAADASACSCRYLYFKHITGDCDDTRIDRRRAEDGFFRWPARA